MTDILIIYSSTDGHTLKICQHLQTLIQRQPHKVTVVSVNDAEQLDLDGFDTIVLGASIRYGHHSPEIHAFIHRHQSLLDNKANAFFSVNLVARKADKNQPQTNPYLKKFLKRITWQPKHLAVFAGKIDYPRYSAFDRTVIRLIMWMTRGPTRPDTVLEFTDWQQVARFAELICSI